MTGIPASARAARWAFRLALAAAAAAWAWRFTGSAVAALAAGAGVAAGQEWVVTAVLVVWIVYSTVAGSSLAQAPAAVASGLALVALARLALGGPRPGRAPTPLAVTAAVVALTGAAFAFAVQLYARALLALNTAPLTLYEALAPLRDTLAGRLVASTLVVSAAAYASYRVAEAVAVLAGGGSAARALLRLEAYREAGTLARALDYPTRILGEILVAMAAFVYVPAVRYLLEPLWLTAASGLGAEATSALAPLAYYVIAWLLFKVTLGAFIQPVRVEPPRLGDALAPLIVAVGVPAALALLIPQVRPELEAALGLRQGGGLVSLDEGVFAREYLGYLDTLVSIIEFTVKFFWSG